MNQESLFPTFGNFAPAHGEIKNSRDALVRMTPYEINKVRAYCSSVVEPYQPLCDLPLTVISEAFKKEASHELIPQFPMWEHDHFPNFRTLELNVITQLHNLAITPTSPMTFDEASKDLHVQMLHLVWAEFQVNEAQGFFETSIHSIESGYEFFTYAKDQWVMTAFARHVVALRVPSLIPIAELPMRYLFELLIEASDPSMTFIDSVEPFRIAEMMEIELMREKVHGANQAFRKLMATGFYRRMMHVKAHSGYNSANPSSGISIPLDEVVPEVLQSITRARSNFVALSLKLLKEKHEKEMLPPLFFDETLTTYETSYRNKCLVHYTQKSECQCGTKMEPYLCDSFEIQMLSASEIKSTEMLSSTLQDMLTARFKGSRDASQCCDWKTVTYWITGNPRFLVFTIGRNGNNMGRMTINHTLNISHLCAEKTGFFEYQLVAVFGHTGDHFENGDYFTCFLDEKWTINQVGVQPKIMIGADWTYVSTHAYVVLYELIEV